MMAQQTVMLDGNEAAARIAHLLNEVVAIYPITPASPRREDSDDWSAAGVTNLWGAVPDVFEMQSEAGAAGGAVGTARRFLCCRRFRKPPPPPVRGPTRR